VNYYLVWRWTEGKAKLSGKTIRAAPNERSWELVLVEGDTYRWYRLAANPFEDDTFAIEWEPTEPSKVIPFLESLKEKETTTIEPGDFPNEKKAAITFYRLLQKGSAKLYEDEHVMRVKLGKEMLILEPRQGVSKQWRVKVSSGPGHNRSTSLPVHFAAAKARNVFLEEERPSSLAPFMKIIQNGDGTYEIKNVPVATVGVFNGVPLSKERLGRIATTFQLLRESVRVPLKVEHHANSATELNPALGWVYNLRLVGDDLVCDLKKVPRVVVELMEKGAYTRISPEIATTLQGYSDVLCGIALLGAEMPAITSLPALIELYSQHPGVTIDTPEIPKDKLLRRKETMNTATKQKTTPPAPAAKKGPEKAVGTLESLLEASPAAVVLFQKARTPEGAEEISKFVNMLEVKGYPKVMAEEMIDLMPDMDDKKVDLIPEYSSEMWNARLPVLEDRAKLPEHAEKVILEIEDFLEKHGEAIDAEEGAREKWEAVLETAREAKGSTTVEEAEAKEVKPAEKIPAEEKYPEVPDNVSIEMKRMKDQLRVHSQRAIDAQMETFAARGMPIGEAALLKRILYQLDTNITEAPDRDAIRTHVFQLIESHKPVMLFSRTMPDSVENLGQMERDKLVQLLSKRGKDA